jgi:hypothetical protein
MGETVIPKRTNCAFIGTGLEHHLRGSGVQTLVIAGVSTNNSVEATVRVAGNLGFQSYDRAARESPSGGWVGYIAGRPSLRAGRACRRDLMEACGVDQDIERNCSGQRMASAYEPGVTPYRRTNALLKWL